MTALLPNTSGPMTWNQKRQVGDSTVTVYMVNSAHAVRSKEAFVTDIHRDAAGVVWLEVGRRSVIECYVTRQEAVDAALRTLTAEREHAAKELAALDRKIEKLRGTR